MSPALHSLSTVNPDHNGFNIYLRDNANYRSILRVELGSWIANDMSNPRIRAEYEDAHGAGVPWFPRSELSLYLKPPIGALYETHSVASRIEFLNGNYQVDSQPESINRIFNPYLSWHGGSEVVEAQGTISLRGHTSGDSHTRRDYNQSPAIAKDSLAGNYNPIGAVVLPSGVMGLPAPNTAIPETSQVIDIEAYEPNFERTELLVGPKAFILDRALLSRSGSAQLTFLAHHPGPLHASRFTDEQRALWLTKPLSFTPANNVPLAVSLIITPVQSDVSLENNPFIFIGYSTAQDQNLIFAVRKLS